MLSCQSLAARGTGGSDVKAQSQISEVQPLKMNENTLLDQKQTSEDQSQPPQEGNQVQQRLVEDKETSMTQQAHQNLPLKKKVQVVVNSQTNQGNSSSELRKSQSVQSLLINTGKRDSCKTRTGVSPNWAGDLENSYLDLVLILYFLCLR